MATVKLSSPWVLFYRAVNAMFERDPEVHVLLDEDAYALKIYVEDGIKAEAINYLMPDEKEFGNVTLKIEVIPANETAKRERLLCELTFDIVKDVFSAAFYANPAFVFAKEVQLGTNRFCYVVFSKEVVQYFSDNLGDYFGVCSTLYQNIANDIFKPIDGVYYCTNNVGYPSSRSNATMSHYRRIEQ